jgi:Hemerythrin HHE cation binding domain
VTTETPPEPPREPLRSLPETTQHHHELMTPHVDALPGLAETIDTVRPDAFARRFEEEYRFIVDQLVPHIDAVEGAIYPELERLLANRHSMLPMRHEHRELLRLIHSLGDYRTDVLAGTLDPAAGMGLRRTLYRLHSMLRVHLAEEEHYLAVLEGNLSPEEKDALARSLDHATAQPI